MEELMNPLVKLRRGEGPFWGTLKRLAKGILRIHLPVFWLTRPFFALLYLVHVGLRESLIRLVCFFWYEPLFRSQCAAVGTGFQMEHLPYIHGTGKIVLGDNVCFGGKPAFIFGNRGEGVPEVVICDYTFIGHNTAFVVSSSVRVGKHCLLAGEVRISDYDGHPIDADRRRAGEPAPVESIRPVVIGDDVWIGNNAIILKGVHIGDRSIVGAGAVVTRDVPPDVIVAGNPARIVKTIADCGLRIAD
jgi:acetyltransferase-like isoleucine patch superfamily enzyme